VVDDRYVLDNLDSSVRQVREYARFDPVLASLPWILMARRAAPVPTLSQANYD